MYYSMIIVGYIQNNTPFNSPNVTYWFGTNIKKGRDHSKQQVTCDFKGKLGKTKQKKKKQG